MQAHLSSGGEEKKGACYPLPSSSTPPDAHDSLLDLLQYELTPDSLKCFRQYLSAQDLKALRASCRAARLFVSERLVTRLQLRDTDWRAQGGAESRQALAPRLARSGLQPQHVSMMQEVRRTPTTALPRDGEWGCASLELLASDACSKVWARVTELALTQLSLHCETTHNNVSLFVWFQ